MKQFLWYLYSVNTDNCKKKRRFSNEVMIVKIKWNMYPIMLKNSLGAFCISVYVEEMILLLSNQESLLAPIALNTMLAFSTPLLYMATFTCEKKM